MLVAAPFVGSLLGVLIRRLPDGRPVFLARSECESCGRALGPLDLVPLASFAALGGACRRCGARIARFHPAVEMAALAVAAWAASADDGWRLVGDCVLGWGLLALAWIDWETFLLPDALTLPLLVAGLGEAWLIAPGEIGTRAAGAAAGWFGLWALAFAYRRVRGREGLGEGDAKLLGAAGAWLGWPALPWVLFAAALAGLAQAGVAALRGARMTGGTAIPFGPALALGIFLVRLYGWMLVDSGGGAWTGG